MVRECKAADISCISFSGYQGRSVWGFPVGRTGNNCVNYAAYRLSANGVPTVAGLGNGGSWAANARAKGFRVDTVPTVGSIAQWGYGSAYAPRDGHVGYVEEVTSSYIVISDSAWSGYSSRWRVPRGDRNWPSSFIHFRDRAYTPPPSGTFVQVRETGEVYRLVGRAPLFVSTWAAFGGAKATHLVSATSLATLPQRPADGTFIQGAQRREVNQVVGGAPVAVTTWTAFGGAKPVMVVDQVAIDLAGSGGRWNHLAALPPDGTFIRGAQRGETYQIAGGAPVFVSSWAAVGGTRPVVVVDQVAIDRAGSSAHFKHLLQRPRDGTVLVTLPGRAYTTVMGGALHPTRPRAVVASRAIRVDPQAIVRAGDTSAPRWMHLLTTAKKPRPTVAQALRTRLR